VSDLGHLLLVLAQLYAPARIPSRIGLNYSKSVVVGGGAMVDRLLGVDFRSKAA
jgi:hypothetical protein